MQKGSMLLLLFMVSLKTMAQVSDGYKYSGGGVFYKVFSNTAGKAIPYGSYVQYSMDQFYNDSLLADTKSHKMIMQIDSVQIPPTYFVAFNALHEGDSVIFKSATDSLKQMYGSLPWIKPGSFINSYFKIEKLFAGKAEADAAIERFNREDAVKDSLANVNLLNTQGATITKYLTAKSLPYTHSPKGTFISITKPGNGKKITSKSEVTVNYTGKTLAGKVFDSNTDPAFNHVEPFSVDISKGNVIRGWLDGLTYFTEGAKGTLYIPSPLAYGKAGAGGDIGPDEILIFDIEVLGVKNPVTTVAPAVKKPVPAATKPKPKTTAVKKS